MAGRGRNLALRIVSALVLGTAVIAALLKSPHVFELICLATGGLAIAEWLRLSKSSFKICICGLVYITASLACLLLLCRNGSGSTFLLLIFVWTSDIFAYAIGRTVGGRKLAPLLSPNKTWSGAIAGLLGPMLAAIVLSSFIQPTMTVMEIVLFGLLAMVTGIATEAGDLLESAVKRHFGVKDSGWLIPGHGGILDRIDGLLLATPIFLVMTKIGT